MTIMKYVRMLLTRKGDNHLEYVKETICESLEPVSPPKAAAARPLTTIPAEVGHENEIAFSSQADLEDYVRKLSVPKEVIESWISAGVLLPEETKVATKMIRIMSKDPKKFDA
jgi:hypothetical protein